MIGHLSPATTTRLEKAAIDNGFDQELPAPEGWLGFASTQAPLRIWLTALGTDLFLITLSQAHVARALGEHGTPMASPLPEGATAGRTVTDIPSLHRLVRRAFQLSRTLPDELLHVFENKTAALPKTTEAERFVVQRVGQGIFRAGLIDYWEGRCAVTGLAIPELLRASHIKPWADCQTDAERLDIFNGILLAPHLDAAFDRGFITLADDGTVIVTADLDTEAREALGLHHPLRAIGLADGHRHYLPWHREKVFRRPEHPAGTNHE
ncbi:HNH endonuclease [Haliangium sp.]|uniref:HNH endonuclease n=1 Tax=Haliangium sp. TaxID=2663208 RepID=UPI003D14CB10